MPFFSCQKKGGGEKSIVVSTGYAGSIFERYVRSSSAAEQFPVTHLSLPVWGPKFKTQIYELLSRYDTIHVFEDHVSHGGFSQWLRALLPKVNILGHSLVDDFVGMVGSQDYLTEQFIKGLEKFYD